jgi:hypothetical protein
MPMTVAFADLARFHDRLAASLPAISALHFKLLPSHVWPDLLFHAPSRQRHAVFSHEAREIIPNLQETFQITQAASDG